jgi:GNAT superfamily N-acetyltransferase
LASIGAADSPPAFTLPAALASEGFSLRLETEDDIPFLKVLYASTREEELAPVPWPPEQKAAFLAAQFNIQRTHYRNAMPNAQRSIIAHAGAPVGRIYLSWRSGRLGLVDISLTPAHRGQGLGTAILRALLSQADSVGEPIGLYVERFNRALPLYLRLGFVVVADGEVYLEMERPVGGGPPGHSFN